MTQNRFILCLFLAVCSCQGSKEKPKDVLSQAQLSSLLVDIYIAEARTENWALVKDSTIRYFIPFEQKLMQGHGVSDSVLRKTYSYYLAHPKELELIYDSVIDTLGLRELKARKVPPTMRTGRPK